MLIIADPFVRVIADKDLTAVQIQKREDDWATIQDNCLLHMNELIRKRGRESKIKEIAEELNVTPTKVKKLLSRYWQRGMNKNAMLLDYATDWIRILIKDPRVNYKKLHAKTRLFPIVNSVDNFLQKML